MAMKELQHTSHECTLTSPEFVESGICNICYKDEPVEFACATCNFDLCKSCSNLPQKVSHDFHAEHPLEFCLRNLDDKTEHILCSCCGCLSSESFYKCKECDIYLDIGCAVLPNIFRSWDDNKKLHFSHAHLLKRCRPGPDAKGSCLLCELPLSPSAICYGCVPCFLFVHERCLDVPIEIQHPMHPAHPLRRFDYTQNCGGGISCDGCGNKITSVPIGCLICSFYLHMRCADSLLRGLMHKSHEHKLFYRATHYSTGYHCCNICDQKVVTTLESYFNCMECHQKIHFECLGILKVVVKKKFHIHQLVCKIFLAEDDSVEYCGVCETMMRVGNHVYSCEECDYLGHTECILRKEPPSPLYLKDLYTCGKDVMKGTNPEEYVTNKLEKMVSDFGNIHVLRLAHNIDSIHYNKGFQNLLYNFCNICGENIVGSLWICQVSETCTFMAHDYCAKLGTPSRHRLHLNHDLTLLPNYPTRFIMNCNICKVEIDSFNLFCRICNIITCIMCVVRSDKFLGVSHRGQKVIGATEVNCSKGNHCLFQVLVSRSYPTTCTICDERLCGKVLSCVECEEIYHPRFIELSNKLGVNHPLHSHILTMEHRSGSKCIACKDDITKYCLFCSVCEMSYHIKCSEGVEASGKNIFHKHTLYNFRIDDLRMIQACSVCGRPCGASFYGCIDCRFCAHLECVGFPPNVKSQQHQHTVVQKDMYMGSKCALCRSDVFKIGYSCKHCNDSFHLKCIMSMDDREAGLEEQFGDVFFMYIERILLNMFEEEENEEDNCWKETSKWYGERMYIESNKTHLYLTTITVILLTVSQATEAHLKSLCDQTPYPPLCRRLVKGPDPRRATHHTIRALELKTKEAIANAGRYKNGNHQVTICYATLTDAAFNLEKARMSIRKRNNLSLKMFLTAAVSDYGVCVNAFIDSRQVNTVQNCVDELRKMGSNCLLLATLIR